MKADDEIEYGIALSACRNGEEMSASFHLSSVSEDWSFFRRTANYLTKRQFQTKICILQS